MMMMAMTIIMMVMAATMAKEMKEDETTSNSKSIICIFRKNLKKQKSRTTKNADKAMRIITQIPMTLITAKEILF